MTGFGVLLKLFGNIIDHPDEEKYRQFNTGNKAIRLKVLSLGE